MCIENYKLEAKRKKNNTNVLEIIRPHFMDVRITLRE